MATGRGDADGVGVPVSVPGLCTDTWRQHSGVAFVGVGAGDFPRDMDCCKRTGGRVRRADVGGRRTENGG